MCLKLHENNTQELESLYIVKENPKIFGRGSFGTVFEAKTLEGGIVAIKKVNEDRRYVNRELEIVKDLDHPNIIHFIHSFRDSKVTSLIYIVMEAIEVNLKEEVVRHNKEDSAISINLVKHYTSQILTGLSYLHSKGFIHRDIKLQNILLNKQNEIKICDFGLSCLLKSEYKYKVDVGTLTYRSPEQLIQNPCYDTGIDYWAVGVTLYYLLKGVAPFKGRNYLSVFKSITNVVGKPSRNQMFRMNRAWRKERFNRFVSLGLPESGTLDKDFKKEIAQVLTTLLAYDSEQRSNASSLPWFTLKRTRISPYGIRKRQKISKTQNKKVDIEAIL